MRRRTRAIQRGAVIDLGRLLITTCIVLSTALPAAAQVPADSATQEFLRQQERERALRRQLERTPDVHLHDRAVSPGRLPADESPCFNIDRIFLRGEMAERFQWALAAANVAGDRAEDSALGRCLVPTASTW